MQQKNCYTVAPRRASEVPGSPSYERLKVRQSCKTLKYVEYFENGQKRIEENLKLGKRNGLKTDWYENGQKKFERNFMNGKREGLTTTWFENGQKKSEDNIKDAESTIQDLTNKFSKTLDDIFSKKEIEIMTI